MATSSGAPQTHKHTHTHTHAGPTLVSDALRADAGVARVEPAAVREEVGG
jgi:hypothetical protein